jgi:hypothetical protein
MSSNWLVKPERACLVSRCEKGARVFITAVMRSADIDAWRFFIRPLSFFLNHPSAFIDPNSTEIGNADIAANVLGCAAKVPSFLSRVPFRRQYSAETRMHPIFHVSVRLIATRPRRASLRKD